MRIRDLSVSLAVVLLLGQTVGGAGWPEFRGPWGNGHATAPGSDKRRGLPLRWSEAKNVRWKTAIPHRGWSTPVILGGQVWLTTATRDGHDFFALCVDAQTGQIRVNEKLFHADDPEPLGNSVNCYASPSPVIEPGRVYVHFGSYGTACLDTASARVLWQRRDLPCRHYRGPASSPILFENLLILSFDGVDVQYTAALDKTSGKTVWKTDRSTEWHDLDAQGRPKREGDFRKAFCTPLVIEANGEPLMISLGAKAAFAYDPRTGREIWKTHHAGHSSAPRPVFGHGLAFVTTGLGRTELWAVRVDGRGDVTDSHVAWKVRRDVPTLSSPVLVGDLLYMVSDRGVVTCLEAATGQRVWRERIGGNHAASPLYGDGRLYFFSRQGETTVLRAGHETEVLATNKLAGGFMASPAVSGQALFLRTKTHLYRIECDPRADRVGSGPR
ncbi:MAG: PQQ-binding-like beta-propeller repeat protein [Planctomycetota bacterium]